MELNGLYITVDTEPFFPVESCMVLYRALQQNTKLYRTAHYPAVLHSTLQHYAVLYRTVQYCKVRRSTVQYCADLDGFRHL